MVHILKLLGIDDSDEVNFVCGYSKEGGPEFHIDGIMPLLRHLHHKDFQVHSIVLGGKKSIDVKIDKPQLLFNSICDADTNSKSLQVRCLDEKRLLFTICETRRCLGYCKRSLQY